MNDDTTKIPYGYCQCGCGQKARINRDGKQNRYILGHRHRRQQSLVEFFWTKVRILADLDLCWEWQGYLKKDGYGYVMGDDGKNLLAHRVAYELSYGEMIKGLLVCHKCDNPKCCNPNHLFLGTHQDNMDDMVRKGRSARGKGKTWKLSSDDVKVIRSRLDNGDRSIDIARDFSVGKRTIIRIKNGHRVGK